MTPAPSSRLTRPSRCRFGRSDAFGLATGAYSIAFATPVRAQTAPFVPGQAGGENVMTIVKTMPRGRMAAVPATGRTGSAAAPVVPC